MPISSSLMAKIEGAKTKYMANIGDAVAKNNYAKGVAKFLGVSEGEVSGGPTDAAWSAEFANTAEIQEKANRWETRTRNAHLRRA